MWGCKWLVEYFLRLYTQFLPGTFSFVDRDMLMRHLGYGIGHKDQTKGILPAGANQDRSLPGSRVAQEGRQQPRASLSSRNREALMNTQNEQASDDGDSGEDEHSGGESESSELDDDEDMDVCL